MSDENSPEGLLIRDAQPADLPAADFAGQMRTYRGFCAVTSLMSLLHEIDVTPRGQHPA